MTMTLSMSLNYGDTQHIYYFYFVLYVVYVIVGEMLLVTH